MATHVNRGLAWIGIASSLVGILDIVAILVILNNWVSQTQYGIATLVVWVFPILDQATDLGLSAAVIQREDHDDTKISTVFWINLMTAVAMFSLLCGFAPIAAHIYDHEIIGWMLVAYGTKLLWQNIYFIPLALMKRELRFKELSIIRIIANFAEFAGKVGFAAAGFGIWCFVLGPLCRVFVTGIGAQLRHPWRPKWIFNFGAAKEYVMFGLKSSGSQILYYFYTNIDYPIVGFFFGEKALGAYRLAYEVVLEPVRMISHTVVDIAFPAFARLQHSKDRLIAQLVSFTKLNLITVLMYSAVVFVAADDLLHLFFPDYTNSATAIRILCAVAVLRAVGFVMPPLLDGTGHPNRTFNYMAAASIVMPIAYWLGAVTLGDQFGVERGFISVTIAWAVGYPIAFGVLMWLVTHTLGWSIGAYLRSVAGVIACMFAALFVALGVHYVLGGQPALIRFLATVAAVLLVSAFSLAYTQGISIRSVKSSMRGEPDAVIDDPQPPEEESAAK
jgi:O-antigen/teichoic acid export membrane protein